MVHDPRYFLESISQVGAKGIPSFLLDPLRVPKGTPAFQKGLQILDCVNIVCPGDIYVDLPYFNQPAFQGETTARPGK